MLRTHTYRILLALLLILPGLSLSAQTTTCSAQVIDAASRKAVRDAVVEILYRGVVEQRLLTDEEGRFSYEVKESDLDGYLLLISHVAYDTRRLPLTKAIEGRRIIRLTPAASELDEYVVTTTRTPSKIENLPIPVSVITRTDIKRIAPLDTKDLLMYAIPGVEMWTHGGIKHIKIQGYDAQYFQFLIDGEEISGLESGSPDLSRISPENVERIEVIKGAGSALYGSGAIGGVINIITKKSRERLSGSLSGGFSMPHQWSGYADLGITGEKWGNTLSGSIAREGDYTITSADGEDGLTMPRNNVFRISDRLHWSPTKRCTLRGSTGFSRRIQEKNAYQHQYYDYISGRVKGIYELSDRSSLALTYNADYTTSRVHFPKKPGETSPLNNNLRQTGRLHFTQTFSDESSLAAGLEGYMETLRSWQINEGEEEKMIYGGVLYGQYIYPIGGGLEMALGLRSDLHRTYGVNISPKITVSYTRGDLRLHSSLSRAFKSPALMELYYNWSHQGMFMIYGNEKLKPETATQMALSGEYKTGKLSLSAGTSLTLFKDQIKMAGIGRGNVTHINVPGISELYSTSLTADWYITNGLTLGAQYAYVYSPQFIEHLGMSYNISMERPHHLLLKASGFKQWGDFSLNCTLMGQYLSPIDYYGFDDSEGSKEAMKKPMIRRHINGYPLLRASLTAAYQGRYWITLAGDNLLDFRPSDLNYQTASFSPGAIFLVKAGVTLP